MKHSKTHYLGEMPRRIPLPDNEFGLKTDSYNRRIATAVKNNPQTVVLETFPHNRLLCKYKNKFMVLDTDRTVILYYMHYRIGYNSFLKQYITCEVLHWKNRGQYMAGLSNISSHVFFKYLLPINGTVMSDHLHTEFSESFWVRRIEEAFGLNLNVYYLNILPVSSTINREIIRLDSIDDFLELTNPDNRVNRSPWEVERKYEGRRILISQHKY